MHAVRVKHNRGVTLIELILYTGLLVVMLSVMYQLFALAGFQKLSEVVENELFTNGQHAMFEIQNSLENASSITDPAVAGDSSNTLSLNGGTTVISIIGTEVIKTEGGVSKPLTDQYVIADSITFTRLGPSTESPTISISLDLRARNDIEGRVRTETFESSVSLR